ncbi:MAG TPA: hypothetical protein VLL27_08810 [Solirubrobacterales bacterium]|nr:hypothetical protein [Solirubrobacterales bacterium]
MTTHHPRLSLLGHALREAAAADLARTETTTAPARSGDARSKRRNRRIGTRTAVALAAAALAVPAAAIATGVFSSEQKVADSIAGSIAFLGAEPTCTTVRQGLEYDCVVDHAQLINGEKLKPGEWDGVVLGSIDKTTNRVNGGCRSQNAEGTRWTCYLGEESVRQRILMPSALGQQLPSPAGP